MITKVERIQGLGIFSDFTWDQQVMKPDGQVETFKHINIIYGRNYSGKTTLSRLLRAMETQVLSDKYGTPQFRLLFEGGSVVDETNYQTCRQKVRVFNEDFVRENLKFIANPHDSIEPFAVIGDDNIVLEQEIEALLVEIGSDDDGNETGLKSQLKTAREKEAQARKAHGDAAGALNGQLREKATGNPNGIRYNSDRYGDQNYNISKLGADIKQVSKDSYTHPSVEEIQSFEATLNESVKDPVSEFEEVDLIFSELSQKAEKLVTQKVGASDKIEELARNAMLNQWVKQGRNHHRKTREKCAFCGNKIDESRWIELDKHFDEESEKLELAIDALIKRVVAHADAVKEVFNVDKGLFYSKFNQQLEDVQDARDKVKVEYQASLASLLEQLDGRKQDIINVKEYCSPEDYSECLLKVFAEYETVRTESNDYSDRLGADQREARKSLRLAEVHDFIGVINHQDQVEKIQDLADAQETAIDERKQIDEAIIAKESLIEAKRREMNDEEKGAKKVNEYLNHFFGHKFLTLEAQENEEDALGSKSIRFEIVRDGQKAFHLSEGECSLLAFCYFLAKLDDVETSGTKPIIWIDDPISSLDANHIFFAYSLLYEEIVSQGRFEQLFVSTHNLDFLKYLKRLQGAFLNHNSRQQPYGRGFFVVERAWDVSNIRLMPEYLKEYVTEFNYLFHQIYNCSQIETVTDENYHLLYNFPNNARKFLEIFLYYKYPHGTRDRDGSIHTATLVRFFGEQPVPAILTNRVNNEYSHLAGGFERGSNPVDAPEIKQVATFIVDRLREDPDQFRAFLSSIGEDEDEEVEGA